MAFKEIKKAENNKIHFPYPSSGLYSEWHGKQIFPVKDRFKLHTDTTFKIVLNDEYHKGYCHPFKGVVTSNYGWRNGRMHKGIDIDLLKGEEVFSVFDGVVRVTGRHGGYGNVVIIRHYNGLETLYAHFTKIKVKEGQKVNAGTVIGLGGSTGNSTGSHLHFEVRLKGTAIDPSYFISFTEHKTIANVFIVRKSKHYTTAYPEGAELYTVKRGDTTYKIAQHFGLSTDTVKQMNNLYGKRMYLVVGQKLLVARE
jgi:murein DD-endopeptidase MepM/ murein hydrolase activator NlpD